jgi:phosphatidate phosphatase PAH1
MPKEKGLESWDDLEVFTSKGAKLKDVRITITDTCGILFNAGMCHKASLEDKSHVILAYSAQMKAIVFQFTSDSNAKGALKLLKRTGGASVGTRSFFSFYFLDPKKLAGRYEPVKERLPRIGEAWVSYLDKKLPEDEQHPQ